MQVIVEKQYICQKQNLNQYLTPMEKLTEKYITDLNVKYSKFFGK